MNDSMKSFKISDAAPRPAGGRKTAASSEEESPASVGFPKIEAEVEGDGPSIDALRAHHAALAEMSQTGSAKEKAAAGKAALAYERTIGLLEHLLQTKAALSAPAEPGAE